MSHFTSLTRVGDLRWFESSLSKASQFQPASSLESSLCEGRRQFALGKLDLKMHLDASGGEKPVLDGTFHVQSHIAVGRLPWWTSCRQVSPSSISATTYSELFFPSTVSKVYCLGTRSSSAELRRSLRVSEWSHNRTWTWVQLFSSVLGPFEWGEYLTLNLLQPSETRPELRFYFDSSD